MYGGWQCKVFLFSTSGGEGDAVGSLRVPGNAGDEDFGGGGGGGEMLVMGVESIEQRFVYLGLCDDGYGRWKEV